MELMLRSRAPGHMGRSGSTCSCSATSDSMGTMALEAYAVNNMSGATTRLLRRQLQVTVGVQTADSLPDRFGNALIDAWLATQRPHAGKFQRREAPLLHGHARHGGVGVCAGAGAKSPHVDHDRKSMHWCGWRERC